MNFYTHYKNFYKHHISNFCAKTSSRSPHDFLSIGGYIVASALYKCIFCLDDQFGQLCYHQKLWQTAVKLCIKAFMLWQRLINVGVVFDFGHLHFAWPQRPKVRWSSWSSDNCNLSKRSYPLLFHCGSSLLLEMEA